MPAPSDIFQFMRGQLFQTPQLPRTTFEGKTVVVTGANTGLGFECAQQLVQLNVSTLILACRSTSKGEAAKEKVQRNIRQSKTAIHVWQIDMASYDSVKAFAARMSRELPDLDALLLNAGISTNEYHVAEGLESTLTVNVVSTFLLALLALPQLEKTAEQTDSPSHLTIVGSNVHAFADHAQLQTPAKGHVFRTLSDDKSQAGMAARYFLSKLIVMFSVRKLASQVPKSKVVVNCPSPGWCKTDLFRQDDGGFMGRNMLRLIGRKADVGARTLPAAIAAEEDTHGQYLSECQVKNTSVFVKSAEGQDVERRIWKELLGTLEDISPGVTGVLSS